MTRYLQAGIILTVLLFTIPAVPALQQFNDYSVDLPEGWTVQRDGITMAFVAPDKSAIMMVTVESTAHMMSEGVTVEDLAKAYADELKGSSLKMVEPGFYSFTFSSPDGLPSEASVVVSGRRFYLITISGKHKDLAKMVESVLVSIP